jgi:hypothetical protein
MERGFGSGLPRWWRQGTPAVSRLSRLAAHERDGKRRRGMFGVGIIIAVGWLVLSYFGFASRANPTRLDVADLLTITSIPVLSVGIRVGASLHLGWT